MSEPLSVASFFTGIGGFDLAFQLEGARLNYQCEIDPFCQKVLSKNFKGVRRNRDIRLINNHDIPKSDIWCAGFPCQDLSLANQGKRLGLGGNRSGLFYTFANLASEAKPTWLVLENVPGLLSHADGQDFRAVLETLDELGYAAAWRVLDAKHFGTPQQRRRVFIVGHAEARRARSVLFDRAADWQMAQPSGGEERSSSRIPPTCPDDASTFAIQHATIGRKAQAGPQGKGWRNDGLTFTFDSRGSADVVCQTNAGFRVRSDAGLSRELDRRRLIALGNAVNVKLARILARRLISAHHSLTLFDEQNA